jgi:hypothetical protein
MRITPSVLICRSQSRDIDHRSIRHSRDFKFDRLVGSPPRKSRAFILPLTPPESARNITPPRGTAPAVRCASDRDFTLCGAPIFHSPAFLLCSMSISPASGSAGFRGVS